MIAPNKSTARMRMPMRFDQWDARSDAEPVFMIPPRLVCRLRLSTATRPFLKPEFQPWVAVGRRLSVSHEGDFRAGRVRRDRRGTAWVAPARLELAPITSWVMVVLGADQIAGPQHPAGTLKGQASTDRDRDLVQQTVVGVGAVGLPAEVDADRVRDRSDGDDLRGDRHAIHGE